MVEGTCSPTLAAPQIHSGWVFKWLPLDQRVASASIFYKGLPVVKEVEVGAVGVPLLSAWT